MISESKVGPGAGVRYLFRGVMVGDGHCRAGTPLRAAQDEAGVPPGVWKGRGLAALGLAAGAVVTERQAELLLGEGRHPDADRIEREFLAQGKSPAQARRATVLGRPIEHNRSPKTDKAKERSPWLGMDLTFRPPPTAHIAWALMDDRHRRVLELCDDTARDKTLAWLEESVAEIRSKAGGKQRARVKSGLPEQCQGVTVLGDGAYINTGLVVPHRKRPGRPLLAGEEADNKEHRRVRARVEHAIGRLKNYKILRDCRQPGDGLHHPVQAVAHMHNLAMAA
ncbi:MULTISPECIES: relaxase domain-containing protein [Streptomyces]|uniref:relaxase domain-containing protein n=1 Tax=Streptomyces TaxID=1883 RepID=UPI001844B856|nr:relaxase domain-containing protein [Streptomyces murinus]MBA9050542.1 hypothetical protein [Streptomyces murinus]